ncbi:iron-containing alcohol dehydrogenase [Calderihabitans maritimus]|uniref:Iron-containing alcohol dehydrogenase n=1 Tax=Calderihabitans maritimus TaxID=1246530 RepID=A0A1Z5HTY9_9FIRM|nr:iron-containing alcohol dehydrogenase [Calderihabitans maritimus]
MNVQRKANAGSGKNLLITRKYGYPDTVTNELLKAVVAHRIFDKIQARPVKG